MKQYFIIRHKVQVISIQTIFHYILSFKTLKPIRNSNIFCFLWILPTSSGLYWYFFFLWQSCIEVRRDGEGYCICWFTSQLAKMTVLGQVKVRNLNSTWVSRISGKKVGHHPLLSQVHYWAWITSGVKWGFQLAFIWEVSIVDSNLLTLSALVQIFIVDLSVCVFRNMHIGFVLCLYVDTKMCGCSCSLYEIE